jgi:hypothetical protein
MMETISPAASSIGSSNNNSNNDDDVRARNASPTIADDERIDVPNENDVLCGRGGSINSHNGNEQFRTFVEKRRRVYLTARFKREKRLIASSIVSEIRGMDPPGRFLARKGNKDSGYWYDIGDEKARDKTSQALRENAPSIRAEIETEINKQREEMRRQEESSMKQAHHLAAAASLKRPPPPQPPAPYHPHGALPPPPGAPVPPQPGHQNQQSYASYAQQYYDYYYHYYGYGAPPPPPPPGYPGGPPSPAVYPVAPPAYWAAQQQQQQGTAGLPREGGEFKEGTEPQQNGPDSSNPAVVAAPAAAAAAAMPQQQQPNLQFPPVSQEEVDHRIAMALQQEENAKAFEDRNRRFGSDRRSSRSAAFCAPGYRPRLLNDHALDEHEQGQSRKRPAMSASRYVVGRRNSLTPSLGTPTHSDMSAPSQQSEKRTADSQEELDHRMAVALQDQEDKVHHSRLAENGNSARKTSRSNAQSQVQRANNGFGLESMVSSGFMAWTRRGSLNSAASGHNNNNDIAMDHDDEPLGMDQKPAVADDNIFMKQLDNIVHHHHNHDHSLGSLSSRGRGVHFKDDSDMISLFGEGGTVIPPPSSTNGSLRVRDLSTNNINPISLDDSQNSRLSQFQKRGNSRQMGTQQRRLSNEHDSSLLSQVASHILGTFGASWAENDGGTAVRVSSGNQHYRQKIASRRSSISSRIADCDMETDMGQEVIIDVRDESNMPPPHPRGPGHQVDWTSRAGCHSWIPETIGANASAFFGSSHDDHDNLLSQDPHDHSLVQDHSLTRENSYSRADISPVNSLDMDMSSSFFGNRSRGGGNTSNLMNLFDQKTNDPHPHEMHPPNHQPVLQQIPSWDRSYRSRSPTISLADLEDQDDSLIRVNSYDVKDKFLSMTSGNDLQYQQQHHNMPPPAPLHHGHHHHHQHNRHKEPHENVLDSSDDMDMGGMDWEGE